MYRLDTCFFCTYGVTIFLTYLGMNCIRIDKKNEAVHGIQLYVPKGICYTIIIMYDCVNSYKNFNCYSLCIIPFLKIV